MRRVAFVLPLLVLAAACGSTDEATDAASQAVASVTSAAAAAPTAAAPAAPAAPPVTAAAPPAGGLSDKSFTSEKPIIKDQFGSFGGTSRITNTSGTTKTAIVTYTLSVGGAQVGTAQGSANAVEAGKTFTVQLLSTDKYVKGDYSIAFQVDTEF